MNKHIISAEELSKFNFTLRLASSAGSFSNKRLDAVLIFSPSGYVIADYVVTSEDNIKYPFLTSLRDAVEKYNELP